MILLVENKLLTNLLNKANMCRGENRDRQGTIAVEHEVAKKVWEAGLYLTVVFLTIASWDAGSAGFHILLQLQCEDLVIYSGKSYQYLMSTGNDHAYI